jgi:hypothetical protein
MRIFFGDEAQQALLRRGAAMRAVTAQDPRFTYYGRTVGGTALGEVPLETVIALAQLQGNSNLAFVPDADVPALRATCDKRGLKVAHYVKWEGGSKARAAADALIATQRVPEDLTVAWLDRDLPEKLRQGFADTALLCGVLPPALDVLTGERQPGIACLAHDASGKVVCCAAAASYLAPEHPHGRSQCWWGMLATHPDRRGERLSLLLGALALREMHRRYGFSDFMTGVEPGNSASEAVCARMGLAPLGLSIVGMADPALLPGGRMTK